MANGDLKLLSSADSARVQDALRRGARRRDVLGMLMGGGMALASAGSVFGAMRQARADAPVKGGRIRVAGTELEGDNLGAIFVQPRPDSTVASVAAVTGTGVAGMRLNDRLPYLQAGVAYPDWTIYGPKILTEGSSGVLGAGYFGADWGLESGDYAWR